MHALHRPYEAGLLKKVWALAEADPEFEGVGSGKMTAWLNENGYHALQKVGRTGLSRASVIFAMNRLVDQGVLTFKEVTGKGGYHRLYRPAMSPVEYALHVFDTVDDALHGIFTGEWWRLP